MDDPIPLAPFETSPQSDPVPPNPHHRIQVASYTFALSISYVLIGIIVIFQIIRILCYRHNVVHYQFGFLAFSLIWSLLRAIFWLWNPWPYVAETALQDLSIVIQFATFAFLVLYLVQVVYKAEGWWLAYRVRVFTVYIATNTFFFLLYILAVMLAVEYGPPGVELDKRDEWTLRVIAFMFTVLVVCMAIYTYKLWYLQSNIKAQLPLKRRKLHILITTIIVSVIFLSRALRDFIASLGVGNLEFPKVIKPGIQVGVFFMFTVWEILPIAVVLILFWHIPHPQKLIWGKFKGSTYGSDIPSMAYDSDIRHHIPINADDSATDDSQFGWDVNGKGLFLSQGNIQSEEEIDPATPVFGTGTSPFVSSDRFVPYNTQSPLNFPRN